MRRRSLILSGANDVHTFCPDADADNLFEGGRQSGNSLYKGIVHTGVGGWFYLTELAGGSSSLTAPVKANAGDSRRWQLRP